MEKANKPTAEELRAILIKLGVEGTENASIRAFTSDEDGSEYAVWLIDNGKEKSVLKRAKGYELEAYKYFFFGKQPYVPALLGVCESDNEKYFLTEYCQGKDLRICDRDRLIKGLDALISLQYEFWGQEELYGCAVTIEKALASIRDRGNYLGSPLIEKAYSKFIDVYMNTPRTLCHDDLLPINLLVGDRAVLIDWEYCGIRPYPESFARLIAHGRDDSNAYFYLNSSDREFAIGYYYENLVRKHGIPYVDYVHTLDHFLLYEYCEWIMLGNRYDSRDDERYGYYLKLAEELAAKLV